MLLIGGTLASPLHASGIHVWGMDPEKLSGELRQSNYESLRRVDHSRYRLIEAERLGDDASFALGLIYLNIGMEEVGERLLRLARERAPEPWRSEAFSRLLESLSKSDRHDEIEALAASEPDREDAQYALLKTLYEQRRFEELEAALGGLDDPHSRSASDPAAQERALWWAVVRTELDRSDWPDAMRSLYRDYPASPVHSRVWVYLVNRSQLLDAFSPDELRFFRFRQVLSEGLASEATDIAAGLVSASSIPVDYLTARWSLSDIYRAGAASGRSSVAAGTLRGLASRSDPEVAARALEYAGRLHRLSGAYAAAVPLLDESLALLAPGVDEQRVRWYLLSVLVRRDAVGAVRRLAAIVPALCEPAYFSDVLFELAGLLAERERWDAMLEAYGAIVDFATPGTLARYEVAIARALESGVLHAAPGRAEELRSLYLERASSQRENLFAALVAAALLGRDGVELLGLVDDPQSSATSVADSDRRREEDLARTYLRFGLTDELFAVARTGADRIEVATRVRAAERLARDGRFRESILIANRFAETGDGVTASVASLRYPAAFAGAMDRRIVDEGLDRAVFYALIREESLFDPQITSVVGATGLAQLMPSTAADIAGRMRLDTFSLTDPGDSVAIGARYFSMLSAQFGSVSRALAAYNAGQGNVRRWERQISAPDQLLFHQAIPFPETYNHVRKVVVSAAYYGYLLEGRPPSDTVRLVFGLDQR